MVGRSFTVIVTSETDGVHGLLEMVHRNMFTPTGMLVMVVLGRSELVIIPPPETRDQVPIPTVAVLADIVTDPVLMQMVWLDPALAVDGKGLTTMVTLDVEGGHTPLVIDHLNTLFPTGKPVIVVVGDNEFVMVPPPEINDHVPTPTVAVLAAMVIEPVEIQIV